MDVLQAAMQNLDNNVWLAINDDISRIYIARALQKPTSKLDLSYAYRKLPEIYEKRIKFQKNPSMQLFQKMGITPVLNEEAITVGDFDTAVDLSVKAFKNIDVYFDLYANNPQDERLPALQRSIDKTAIQISNKQPGMFLFFVNEVETTLKNYQKTGQKPVFNQSLFREKFKRHAVFIQNNPKKIIQAYNAFFKLNEDDLTQRPAVSRDAR